MVEDKDLVEEVVVAEEEVEVVEDVVVDITLIPLSLLLVVLSNLRQRSMVQLNGGTLIPIKGKQ